MFDNINNTKASNIKNNNFKYILFALLLNFVVFFLIFMQESFLIIFDEITYFFIVHDLDLASVTDRLFANDVIKKFIDDNAKLYYSMLDNYLGSEHYIRQDNLRKIYLQWKEQSFPSQNATPITVKNAVRKITKLSNNGSEAKNMKKSINKAINYTNSQAEDVEDILNKLNIKTDINSDSEEEFEEEEFEEEFEEEY